jgi:hypothetical protein
MSKKVTTKKVTTKKVTSKTNPFNTELMGFIKDGQIQRERFVALTDEIIKSSVKDNYPHLYIQSPPGIGKTWTIENAFKKNKIDYHKISGSVSMFKFGVQLAVIAKNMGKNDMSYIYIDDCNELLKNEENINIMKNILRDEKTYSYQKNMRNLMNSLDPLETQAVEKFIKPGGGFVVPTNNFVFIITSNTKLPNTDEVRTNKDKHLNAIRDRVNVKDFTMKPTTMWGYITDIVLKSTVIPKEVPTQIRVEACQFFYDNWESLNNRSIREVERMLQAYQKHPKNYKMIWETEFKK